MKIYRFIALSKKNKTIFNFFNFPDTNRNDYLRYVSSSALDFSGRAYNWISNIEVHVGFFSHEYAMGKEGVGGGGGEVIIVIDVLL